MEKNKKTNIIDNSNSIRIEVKLEKSLPYYIENKTAELLKYGKLSSRENNFYPTVEMLDLDNLGMRDYYNSLKEEARVYVESLFDLSVKKLLHTKRRINLS